MHFFLNIWIPGKKSFCYYYVFLYYLMIVHNFMFVHYYNYNIYNNKSLILQRLSAMFPHLNCWKICNNCSLDSQDSWIECYYISRKKSWPLDEVRRIVSICLSSDNNKQIAICLQHSFLEFLRKRETSKIIIFVKNIIK